MLNNANRTWRLALRTAALRRAHVHVAGAVIAKQLTMAEQQRRFADLRLRCAIGDLGRRRSVPAIEEFELPAELPLQILGVPVVGGVVLQLSEPGLEVEQALDVVVEVAGEDEIVAKISIEMGPGAALEVGERGFELLQGVAPNLGEEEHDKDVAVLDRLVVFLLEAFLRHRVDEVLPDDQNRR